MGCSRAGGIVINGEVSFSGPSAAEEAGLLDGSDLPLSHVSGIIAREASRHHCLIHPPLPQKPSRLREPPPTGYPPVSLTPLPLASPPTRSPLPALPARIALCLRLPKGPYSPGRSPWPPLPLRTRRWPRRRWPHPQLRRGHWLPPKPSLRG